MHEVSGLGFAGLKVLMPGCVFVAWTPLQISLMTEEEEAFQTASKKTLGRAVLPRIVWSDRRFDVHLVMMKVCRCCMGMKWMH